MHWTIEGTDRLPAEQGSAEGAMSSFEKSQASSAPMPDPNEFRTPDPAEISEAKPVRKFTSKQMGDACEMLVAAELTLAGVPALKVPDNWPHYDVIAQPIGSEAQRISVKARTYKRGANFVNYNDYDRFDWLAIVLLTAEDASMRTLYVVPRSETDRLARRDKPTSKTANLRYFRIDEIERLFGHFRDNFALSHAAGQPS